MEEDGTANARIFIAANVTVNDTFFPMIRKSTETDSSFVPYENSCPISGWTGLKIVRTGNSGFGAEFTLQNMNRNLNWKIFAYI
ncbi:MAG: hypothetical protein IJ210_05775 [Clostridia bacterium]|nr:hypothetical protein [Clostridia bacterium]